MTEERRPLFITEKQLDMLARTPIFEVIPSWDSLMKESMVLDKEFFKDCARDYLLDDIDKIIDRMIDEMAGSE
jgi:hypothetical protein